MRFNTLILFVILSIFSSSIAIGDEVHSKKKFTNAKFDAQEFIGHTLEARQLARIQNERAALEVYDQCFAAIKGNSTYKTDEERMLAVKVYCPPEPTHGLKLKKIDVACETGQGCGKRFEVTKKELASFKSFFVRKAKAVAKAQSLGMHVDKVDSFVYEYAKAPNRLYSWWMKRALENFAEPDDEEFQL